MQDDRCGLLESVLSCSTELLQAARDERWDDLAEIERRRDAMLRAYACRPRIPDDAAIPHVSALLSRLIEINAEVLLLVEGRRNSLHAELADNRRQRNAATAYASLR